MNYYVPQRARRRMNAGIADMGRAGGSGDPPRRLDALAQDPVARIARSKRRALLMRVSLILALRIGVAHAQVGSMLDDRVTQQSVRDTICRPGYAEAVAPPFDELMAHKDRMLAERGMDAEDGFSLALDRRVPIVLGGSPDAPANLDLLPWAGKRGERRKARAAVMLKRCVCEGKLSLAHAQAVIVGNWSIVYSGFGHRSCDVSRHDTATPGDSGGDAAFQNDGDKRERDDTGENGRSGAGSVQRHQPAVAPSARTSGRPATPS
jgi:hypothetical protein